MGGRQLHTCRDKVRAACQACECNDFMQNAALNFYCQYASRIALIMRVTVHGSRR
ncbi:hypothetical protein OKW43_002662 [Paraburkholderia sp. WC7.3g]